MLLATQGSRSTSRAEASAKDQRPTTHESRVTSHELRATSHESRTTLHASRFTRYARRPFGHLVVAVLFVAVNGCAPRAATPARLVAQEKPHFADLPIPIGFEMVKERSEDRLTGRRRVYLRHVYEGRGDSYAVRDFYIEHMPQHQWQMVHAGAVAGLHTMRFEKGTESCTITITEDDSGWRNKVRMEMMVLQEERGEISRQSAVGSRQ